MRHAVHCKNIRISKDNLWRVVHILTESVPYTLDVYGIIKPGPTLQGGFIIPSIYGSVKYEKLATKYSWMCGHFTV